MKQCHRVWNRIRVSFRKIHLIDKCLLLLMLVLLSQSAYILLANNGSVAETNHIDVIVRTASASIFGYLISANFIQHGGSAPSETKEQQEPDTKAQQDEPRPPVCARIQIITATAIALFCLITLIVVRNMSGHDGTTNPSTAAVIAQFRDFVSGCVGFLIGCPTPKSEDR